METKRIYLACPYSHTDPAIRQKRYELASKAAANLTAKGLLVYSPITEGHTLAQYAELPTEFAYWQTKCESFLQNWATELYVLQEEGFEESIGVQAEITKAKGLGIPITHLISL